MPIPPISQSCTDEELAAHIQQGSEEALSHILERYEQKLLRYGKRFLGAQGEDAIRQAVQDIFISVYQNIEGFNTTQRFSPWIYRIAHNAFIDILRQTTRQPFYGIDLDTVVSHSAPDDTFLKEKENEELRVLIEKGLDTLSSSQREIMVLYYFEELGYKEIADVLHIPISTVGVRLARARANLKTVLPDPSLLPL